MSCVLRIIGENLDVDTFVGKTNMAGFRKSYKGELINKSKTRYAKHSAASITTSDADFDDIKRQIDQTIDFLNYYKNNLSVIASTIGIEYATIDFGVDSIIDNDRLTQSFYFNKDLIKICAALEIGIELSIYKQDMEVILEQKRLAQKISRD